MHDANKCSFYRAANICINSPSDNFGIVMTLYVDTENYAIQVFFSLNNEIYIRNKSNGTWRDWKKVG